MSQTRKIIENQSKDTLGYVEAKDKESFMTGLGVAISIYENLHQEETKRLTHVAEFYKKAYENTVEDFKTIRRIFANYEPYGE